MKLYGLDPKNYSRFSHSSLSLFDAGIRVQIIKKVYCDPNTAPHLKLLNTSVPGYSGLPNVAVGVEKLNAQNQKPGITWTNVKPKLEIRNDPVNSAELEAITDHLKVLLVKQKYRGSVGFVAPFRAQVLEFENLINQKFLVKYLLRQN